MGLVDSWSCNWIPGGSWGWDWNSSSPCWWSANWNLIGVVGDKHKLTGGGATVIGEWKWSLKIISEPLTLTCPALRGPWLRSWAVAFRIVRLLCQGFWPCAKHVVSGDATGSRLVSFWAHRRDQPTRITRLYPKIQHTSAEIRVHRETSECSGLGTVCFHDLTIIHCPRRNQSLMDKDRGHRLRMRWQWLLRWRSLWGQKLEIRKGIDCFKRVVER